MDRLIRWLDFKSIGFDLLRRDEMESSYFVIPRISSLSSSIDLLLRDVAGFVHEAPDRLIAPITTDRFNQLSSIFSVKVITVLASSVDESTLVQLVTEVDTDEICMSVDDPLSIRQPFTVMTCNSVHYSERDIASFLHTPSETSPTWGQTTRRYITGRAGSTSRKAFKTSLNGKLLWRFFDEKNEVHLPKRLVFIAVILSILAASREPVLDNRHSIQFMPNYSDRINAG